MAAFLIARLPSHPKSLDAVAYMQKNAFSYRISTSIPLMNFLMTSEGGDSRQLEVFEKLEPGKEEVHIIANMTCIFPPQIKAEVDSTETSATNGNSAPLERIVKEEVDASTVDQPDDHYPRLEMSTVTNESVVPRENPSVDVGHAAEEVVDDHLEQPEEEINSFLNQRENDDVTMNNVLLSDNNKFDESNAEKLLNIPMAVTENVHDVPTEPVRVDVQQGAEEHEEPHFPDEEEGAGDEQRLGGGEGHELTVDELLEPLDAGDSLMALRPLHNNDVLFDFEDSSRLNDELPVEKEIIEPEDGEEENMEVDRNVEEFEEEEELVEEQEHEDDKMDVEEIEEQLNEGIDDEGDMEGEEVDSDEAEASDDEENASSDEKDDKVNKRKKKDDRAKGNIIGRHLYTCFVKNCSSSFKTFEELEEHVKVHTGKQEFSCDVCKKKFSSKGAAMAHIQERKKKECCACGNKCSQNYNLIRHYRRHTGEKPYVCKTCGKGFAQAGTLKKHMLTHTGEKRFSCAFCKRRFALKQHLEIHELTHTGEKPFECKDCWKRFTQKVHLNTHIRTHSGQKPYSCKKCDAKFIRSGSLKYHMEHKHK